MTKKKIEILTKDKDYSYRGKEQVTRRVNKEQPGESAKFSGTGNNRV